jgi:hypothetical protein
MTALGSQGPTGTVKLPQGLLFSLEGKKDTNQQNTAKYDIAFCTPEILSATSNPNYRKAHHRKNRLKQYLHNNLAYTIEYCMQMLITRALHIASSDDPTSLRPLGYSCPIWNEEQGIWILFLHA